MKNKYLAPAVAAIIIVSLCIGFFLPDIIEKVSNSNVLDHVQTYDIDPVSIKEQKETGLTEIFRLVADMNKNETVKLDSGEYFDEQSIESLAGSYVEDLSDRVGISRPSYEITGTTPVLLLDAKDPEVNTIVWVVDIHTSGYNMTMVINDYYGVLVGIRCKSVSGADDSVSNDEKLETCYDLASACAYFWYCNINNVNDSDMKAGNGQTIYVTYSNGYDKVIIPITAYGKTDYSIVIG